MAAPAHRPVLLPEVLAHLQPRDEGIYVDATFGRGGYTLGLLRAARCRVLAVDRDPSAIAAGADLAGEFGDRLTLLEGRFGALDRLVGEAGAPAVDGIAFDLGVSSPQLDEAGRGFSFRADGPLDMRMGGDGPSAADLVNGAEEGELARILREYGEERFAGRVARAIGAARADKPIATTGELAAIVRRVVPPSRDGIDQATRTFQGLRIAVNDELGELDRGLVAAERLLAPGGRLVVVSFHSLEDRRVKRFLADRSGKTGGISRHMPAPANDRAPTFKLLTRKPVTAGADAVRDNPRARSAKLRAAERTDAPAADRGVAA